MSKRGSCRHDNEVVVGHGTDVSHRGGHLAHGDCGCCGQRNEVGLNVPRGAGCEGGLDVPGGACQRAGTTSEEIADEWAVAQGELLPAATADTFRERCENL